MIAAPVVRDQKGAFEDLFDELVSEGYSRVEVDGESHDLTIEAPELDKNYDHTIDVIVDRVKISAESRPRIGDSVETALEEADGVLKLIIPDPPEEMELGSNTRSTGSLAGEGDDRIVAEVATATRSGKTTASPRRCRLRANSATEPSTPTSTRAPPPTRVQRAPKVSPIQPMKGDPIGVPPMKTIR